MADSTVRARQASTRRATARATAPASTSASATQSAGAASNLKPARPATLAAA